MLIFTAEVGYIISQETPIRKLFKRASAQLNTVRSVERNRNAYLNESMVYGLRNLLVKIYVEQSQK